MTMPGAGMGVDSHGGPVIDPTANVIALVKAQQEFNEKLRINDDKWADRVADIQHKLEQEQKERAIERDGFREKLAEKEAERQLERDRFREKLAEKEAERVNAVILAESHRIDMAALAEARRIDAIVAEQKVAAALDREKNAIQAQTLAAQVTTSAEVVRSQAQSRNDTLDSRVSKVERDMAGGAGKETGGKDTAASIRTAIQFGIGLLLALVTIVGFLLARK